MIKSARVMKKAVGHLIPFMEKEKEDMYGADSVEVKVSLLFLTVYGFSFSYSISSHVLLMSNQEVFCNLVTSKITWVSGST